MITTAFRDIWAEPQPVGAHRSSRADAVLVALLIGAGLLDGLLSADVGWKPVHIPVMTVLSIAIYWRRTHTLAVTVLVAAAYGIFHTALLVAGVSSTFLNAGIFAVCVYTLGRWASGRDAIIGLAAMVIGIGLAGSTGVLREASGALGMPLFFSLFLLLGLSLRFWSSRGTARLSEAKMSERNRIARELHDTVAHHVSAIAIQAQGGQAVLTTDPESARAALVLIEEQASQTLTEMRLILGVLRDHDATGLAPPLGLRDIAGLADDSGAGPVIEVAMTGDLERLSPVVGGGLFRLAQEAVTNARRHADGATKVVVAVSGDPGFVRLRVTDDGQAAVAEGSGFGLLGMAERASLLGGECHAGPGPSSGWVVTASLPRAGDWQ